MLQVYQEFGVLLSTKLAVKQGRTSAKTAGKKQQKHRHCVRRLNQPLPVPATLPVLYPTRFPPAGFPGWAVVHGRARAPPAVPPLLAAPRCLPPPDTAPLLLPEGDAWPPGAGLQDPPAQQRWARVRNVSAWEKECLQDACNQPMRSGVQVHLYCALVTWSLARKLVD